jgi:hypothetical protein
MLQQHVIFLQSEPMDAFIGGTKRFEFRVARRRQPWVRARVGDHAFLKRVGGAIEMAGIIVAMDLVDVRAGDDLGAFVRRWCLMAMDGGSYWARPGAIFAAAFELGDLERIFIPPELTPRGARSGWVTLDPALSSPRAMVGVPSVRCP